MNKIKRALIIFLLLCPLAPYFYKISESEDFSISADFLKERTKVEKKLSDVLHSLDKLKGSTLVMRQGEILHYTNLNFIHLYDQRFSDIFTKQDLSTLQFVALNHYNDPVMYSPFLESILYDPTKSRIIFDSNNWKIFKIAELKAPPPYASANLQVSFLKKEGSFNVYASHQGEYPDVDIMPDAEDGYFPSLKPGLYDFICEVNVEVNTDTQMDLKVHPYLGASGTQTFYLKKGKNRFLTRFLHSHNPFRLVFTSKNPDINFNNTKLSYGLHDEVLSPKNLLCYQKNGLPVIANEKNKSIIEINKEELLAFDKTFSRGEILSFNVSGDGVITIRVIPAKYGKLEQLSRWELGQRILLYLLSTRSYKHSMNVKEKTVSIPFEEESNVYIYIKSRNRSEARSITLRSLSIKKIPSAQ